MADAKTVGQIVNRSGTGSVPPVPILTVQPLPEKHAKIDPAGARKWEADMNARFSTWTTKLNMILSEIQKKIGGT